MGVTPCLQRTLLFDRLHTGGVNRTTRVLETASGKGTNVARIIRILDGSSLLISVCGGDTGKQFKALLQKDGVPHSLVPSGYPMRICQTLIDEASGSVTELVEEASPFSLEETMTLRQLLAKGLEKSRWVVISGSPPPGASPTFYRDLIQQAQESDGRILLDTQKEPLLRALSANPWLVKLNRKELATTLERDIRTPNEIIDSALVLIERGAQNVVVTQGPHMVWWMSHGGIRKFVPPKVQAVNPIGSGDAMTAGIALGVSRGDSFEESLRLGIACGAANALTLTSGVVQPDSVQQLLVRIRPADSESG
jgi:tagatose 6-phosphate kinase